MRTIILFLVFTLIGTVSYAQKNNTGKENKGKDQDTKIIPGASGVKRSIGYHFSSITDVSDPGEGVFRYNSKNITGVDFIIVDKNDIKGEDQTNWYETWDKTTGATGRGRLTLVELNGDNVNVFDVTDVFVDGNGYWKLPVEYVSGTLPLNDTVYYYVFERIAHGGGQGNRENEEIEEIAEAPVVIVTEPVVQEPEEIVEAAEPVVEEVAEVVEEAPVVVEAAEPIVEEVAEVVEEAPVVVEAAEPVVEEVAEVVEEAPVVVEAAEPVVEEVAEVVEEVPVVVEAAEPVVEEVAEVVEEALVVVEAAEPVVEEVAEVVEEAPVVVEAPEPVVEEPITEVVQEPEEVIEPAVKVVAEVVEPEPVPKEEPKVKPSAPIVQTVTQPEKIVDEVPDPQKTDTRRVAQPEKTTDEAPAPTKTETRPINKPAQEEVTIPLTQPSRDTQTTVGAGRRTISSTKQPVTQPAQETKTTTTTRETRNVPVAQPIRQTETKPITQPAPIPERQPLPEPKKEPPTQVTLKPVQETQKEPVNQPAPEKYDDFPVVQNYYQSSGGRSHGKCYRGIIEIGYALRVSEYGMNNFRFNFINGFNIKNTSIGLGIGVRKYFDTPANHPDWHLVSSDVQIPVFLDIRTRFSSKTLTPYLGIGIGGSQEFDSDTTNNKPVGLYFHATGGIWFNLSDRFAIFCGFAYEMQKLEYANFSDEIPYKKNTNSISINVGIAF